MSTVSSNAELSALASGTILLSAEYSFHNPNSINGPFGNFSVILSSDGSVHGKAKIQTLFGMGSVTRLVYTGTATFNGSTGYTTIQAKGTGTVHTPLQPPRHVTILLAPGFQTGTFAGYPAKRTDTEIHDHSARAAASIGKLDSVNSGIVVGKGCVGECGPNSTVVYNVQAASNVLMILKNIETSLCPTHGAHAWIFVNGCEVAHGNITRLNSSIQAEVSPGDRVIAHVQTFETQIPIACFRLGNLFFNLIQQEFVG